MKAIAIGMIALTGLSHALGSAVSPAVSVVPGVRFTCVVRFAPPSQMQHSVQVVGETLPGRDLHPARKRQASLGALTLAVSRAQEPERGTSGATVLVVKGAWYIF